MSERSVRASDHRLNPILHTLCHDSHGVISLFFNNLKIHLYIHCTFSVRLLPLRTRGSHLYVAPAFCTNPSAIIVIWGGDLVLSRSPIDDLTGRIRQHGASDDQRLRARHDERSEEPLPSAWRTSRHSRRIPPPRRLRSKRQTVYHAFREVPDKPLGIRPTLIGMICQSLPMTDVPPCNPDTKHRFPCIA